MSYGLPPACGSTSQPSQHRLPESDQDRKPASHLEPNALPFVSRDSRNDRPSKPKNIRHRQTTSHRAPSAQRRHPSKKKQSPEAARENINKAYIALKSKQFSDAEEKFQAIIEEYRGQLSQADYRNSTIGLARSLKEQTPEKQKKACSLLQELRLEAPLTKLGASRIPNLDLTLSRCEQALGWFPKAEERLLRLRHIEPDADEEILCRYSRDFDADIANARLWSLMNKHQMTETLLVNMKKRLINKLQWNQCTATTEGLHKQLRVVNIALVRLLQDRGLYEWSEDLLLNISGKRSNGSEENLCQPCGDNEIDLALARLWQLMGKNERAEKLLLSMSHRHPDASEEILCRPFKDFDIDLTLVLHWEVMDKYHLAEKLLLNMVGKQFSLNKATLCQPCGNDELDLILARLWQAMGKNEWAERLLLNMSDKHPDDTEETLCKACRNPLIDLALARIWEVIGKHTRTEKLLLNMSGKQPDDTEEDLCKPSGNHDLDLALVRVWQVMDKNERAQRLIHRCCDIYHTIECELALLSSCSGTARFMEMVTGYQENANTLMLTSVHYFKLASQQITDNDPESGQDNLKKALEYVESALEKYPPSAGAYSQKAHCLRMMRYPEDEWQEWFRKADTLDPSRGEKFKANDVWRLTEARAVEKLKHQARRT